MLIKIANYFTGLLGDLWNFLRNFTHSELFQAFGPFIMGGIGIFTFTGEGIQGIKEIYNAYRNPNMGQRRTRIASSLLITLFAATGISLAIILMVAASGVAIPLAGTVMAPIMIPSILTGIYGLVLWRKTYIFNRAKNAESDAFNLYQDAVRLQLDEEVVTQRRQAYQTAREVRLQAECRLAFSVIECLTQVLVVVSTLLSATAVFATSAASFGILPAAILMVGLGTAYFGMLFEIYDKNNQFKYTRMIRNGLVHASDKVTEGFRWAQNKILSCFNKPPVPGLELGERESLINTSLQQRFVKKPKKPEMIEMRTMRVSNQPAGKGKRPSFSFEQMTSNASSSMPFFPGPSPSPQSAKEEHKQSPSSRLNSPPLNSDLEKLAANGPDSASFQIS